MIGGVTGQVTIIANQLSFAKSNQATAAHIPTSMAARFLLAAALCPFALAFSDTVPLLAWSSYR